MQAVSNSIARRESRDRVRKRGGGGGGGEGVAARDRFVSGAETAEMRQERSAIERRQSKGAGKKRERRRVTRRDERISRREEE